MFTAHFECEVEESYNFQVAEDLVPMNLKILVQKHVPFSMQRARAHFVGACFQ